MKIRIMLKDPDTMADAVESAVTRDTKGLGGISEAERVHISRERASSIQGEITERWMPYGEYLSFEVDTETWTATILPAQDSR